MRNAGLLLIALGLAAGGCAPRGDEDRDAAASHAASGSAAPARAELPAEPTLADFLRLAAERNPGVLAARQRWLAARERAPQMRSLPDPQLMYEYWGLGEAEQQMLTASLTVPWPGKLTLAGRQAGEEARAEYQRYQSAGLALAFRVKSAWFEHWYLARAIEIAGENAALAREIEEAVRTRYKAGVAEFSDVVKAQVELARMEDMVKEFEQMRSPIAARLNAELDRPSEAPLPAAPKTFPGERLALPDAEVLSLLEKASPELAAMDAEVAAARHAVGLAKRGPIPDLMFKAGAMTMKAEGMDREDGPQLGVGITVPLWFGKYRAMRREAGARLAAAELSRRDTANHLGSEVKMTLFSLRDADRKVGLYLEAIIPRAEQAAAAALAGYRAGRVQFADLVDAERVLIQFRLDYARAVANRAQRLAELEMMVGRALSAEADRPTTSPADAGDRGSQKEARP